MATKEQKAIEEIIKQKVKEATPIELVEVSGYIEGLEKGKEIAQEQIKKDESVIRLMELAKEQGIKKAQKEEIEFLKLAKQNSLGVGIGEFVSMDDWEIIIGFIDKRLTQLQSQLVSKETHIVNAKKVTPSTREQLAHESVDTQNQKRRKTTFRRIKR